MCRVHRDNCDSVVTVKLVWSKTRILEKQTVKQEWVDGKSLSFRRKHHLAIALLGNSMRYSLSSGKDHKKMFA